MRAMVFDKPRSAARVLRALAFTACVPYLALKIAWVSGSRVGIPDGSMLLEHHTAMIAGNSASVLIDSMVVVLALLLTQPWGRRAPAWLLILPAWAATGLLSPIMVGYPLQLGARLLGGTAAPSGGPAARPFLDEWVFTVVYTGFIVQALALGALFVLYARARWGHLWRGRISGLAGQGPTRGVQRATALMASAVVLVPLTAHLLWATGSASGLTATKIAERTSDFYALEAAYVLFAVMTVTGLLLVAFPARRPAAAASAVPGLRRLRGARVLGRLHDAHCAGKSRPVAAHQRADERHVLDAAPRRDAGLHHGGILLRRARRAAGPW